MSVGKRKIVMSCFPDCSIKVEGFGFVGTECNKTMAPFEKALGKTTERQNKGDIHKQGRVNVQNV